MCSKIIKLCMYIYNKIINFCACNEFSLKKKVKNLRSIVLSTHHINSLNNLASSVYYTNSILFVAIFQISSNNSILFVAIFHQSLLQLFSSVF